MSQNEDIGKCTNSWPILLDHFNYQFQYGRSIAAQRYQKLKQQTKPEMVCELIARAIRGGTNANYFLADTWFATKHILRMTIEHSLIAILRMKKTKSIPPNDKQHYSLPLCSRAIQTPCQRLLANT
ncbi:MAG: hypothetical protein ACJASU_001025 [Cognaticolwellia sp.]|jgi:hypothetical protein